MKIFKVLVLLLVVGIAIIGCYWMPDVGDVELSMVLPKTLLEDTPLSYIMQIKLGQDTNPNYVCEWELPVPSYNAEKKSSGVIALKVPIGENYYIHLEIGTFAVDGKWMPDTTGDSGLFDVEPYSGNVKVDVTLS